MNSTSVSASNIDERQTKAIKKASMVYMLIRILIIGVFFAMGNACASSPTNKEIVAPPTATPKAYVFDREKAKLISDSIVDSLIKDDRKALYSGMETTFRGYYDKNAFDDTVNKMFEMYGAPMEAKFKKVDEGMRHGTGGYEKPMLKHWYAVKTSRHDYGKHFIFVEIVPDDNVYASSGVAIVKFPLSVPDDMK